MLYDKSFSFLFYMGSPLSHTDINVVAGVIEACPAKWGGFRNQVSGRRVDRMKKVLVAVLMFFALLFAFTSCGPGGGDTAPTTQNSLKDPTSAKFIPAVDDSLKSVNVPIIPTTK
jgi:hypothetical protein